MNFLPPAVGAVDEYTNNRSFYVQPSTLLPFMSRTKNSVWIR